MGNFVDCISLADRFVRAAERTPDGLAVVVDDEEMTYTELLHDATEVARALMASGVARGDNVGLLMPSGRRFAACYVGAALAGARVIPVNTRYRTRELRYLVGQAEITVLMTTDVVAEHVDFVALLGECFPDLRDQSAERLELADAPLLRAAVLFGDSEAAGFLTEQDFLSRAAAVTPEAVEERRRSVRLRDVAVISYTSGTTSWPKGCMLTHEALSRMWDGVGERIGAREGDMCWAPSPMFHAAGYGALIMMAGVYGTVLTQCHFEPKPVTELLVARRPRLWYSPFPPVTDAVLEQAERDGADLGATDVLIYASPGPERFDAVARLLDGTTVIQPYGQTEAAAFVTMGELHESLEVRRGGCGDVFPGVELRVVDPDTLEEVAPGVYGEIQFRGWNSFEGYFQDPERTAETILDGGWVRTGDGGLINEHGQLRFVSRIKDMLKVGGENVAPAEIEAHLGTHPAVRAVQVVGAPDSRLHEVPAAFVELHEGATAGEQELIDHCRGQVAGYKVPRHVRFVTEWPMSATKIQKFQLRERIARELADGDASG